MIRVRVVPGNELNERDQRLDGFYYCSVGAEARRMLAGSGIETEPLGRLCDSGGPFIPQHFVRPYVRDARYGLPYLTGSSLMLADPLEGCDYLSRRPGMIPRLASMTLVPHSILVTCSGALGRAMYVPPWLPAAVGSPDLLRIVPDRTRIPSGYLYCFLTSEMGKGLLLQGTYGGTIPHIEAAYTHDMPVPRLDSTVEASIDEKVQRASAKRGEARELLAEADQLTHQLTSVPSTFGSDRDHAFALGCVDSGDLAGDAVRLDAYHYIGYAGEVRSWRSSSCPMRPIGDVAAEVFNPPIFKRLRVQDGVPYLLGAEVYWARPRASTQIARQTPDLDRYILALDTIVFEDAGQRYGLLGTPVYVGRTLAGNAATNNMTRIACLDSEDAGFLFALLRTPYGRRLIVRHSYGTSLPHLLPRQIAAVEIPWPDSAADREVVAKLVHDAVELRDQANDLEDEAQVLLKAAVADRIGAAPLAGVV